MKKPQTSVIVAILVTLIFYTTGNFSQEQSEYLYVGADKCASPCHNAKKIGTQYDIWKSSPHSKAFTILSSENAKLYAKNAGIKDSPLKSTQCLKCHVTGYRKRGGFKKIEKTPEMAGVGCESCHGPGSEYSVLHDESPYGVKEPKARAMGQVYGAKDKDVCRACHGNKDNPMHGTDPKYDFDWDKSLKNRDAYHPKSEKKQQFRGFR